MAELNAAWEALRDPARRQEHDRSAGPSGLTRPGRAPAGGPRVDRAGGGVDGVPRLEPEVEDHPTVVRRRRWGSHAPTIVVVLCLCLVGLVGCLAAVTSGPPPEDVDTTQRFPVGSCISVSPAATVSEAVCGEPGARSVLARVLFPRPCPTGTVAILVSEQSTSLCVAPAP